MKITGWLWQWTSRVIIILRARACLEDFQMGRAALSDFEYGGAALTDAQQGAATMIDWVPEC